MEEWKKSAFLGKSDKKYSKSKYTRIEMITDAQPAANMVRTILNRCGIQFVKHSQIYAGYVYLAKYIHPKNQQSFTNKIKTYAASYQHWSHHTEVLNLGTEVKNMIQRFGQKYKSSDIAWIMSLTWARAIWKEKNNRIFANKYYRFTSLHTYNSDGNNKKKQIQAYKLQQQTWQRGMQGWQ